MSIFTWPFKRKQYAGLGNPRFVGDIVAANEAINDALAAIVGTVTLAAGGNLVVGATYVVVGGSITYNATIYAVGSTFTVVTGVTTFATSSGGYVVSNDFFIIAGLDYVMGVSNTFNPGIFYLQGQFYIIGTAFAEGLYLSPNPTDTMSQLFGDGNSRNIYTLMQAITTSTSSGTTTPIFSGNMNAYRIGAKYTNTLIQSLLATQAALGSAAFLPASASPVNGEVALWNNLYTQAQINAGFVALAGGTMTGALVLSGDPGAPLGAATKQYVDSSGGKRLASGNQNIGDVNSSGTTQTVSLGTTLADNNYMVLTSIVSAQTNPYNDTSIFLAIRNKTTTSFDVILYEARGVVQNISIDWVILHF